jgi:RHS repeat-associated protein
LLQEAMQMVMQPGGKALQGLPVNQETAQLLSASVATLQAAHDASAKAHPVTIRHYLTDHLGTPIALVDANGQHKGQITWAASYNAWGDIKEEYNPRNLQQPIRFQGQQIDAETGLHYNRFRYYDPSLGQYVTQDPIGLNGGVNTGVYPANPLSFVDPMGLDPTAGTSRGPDLGKVTGAWDLISDAMDWKENKEIGRQLKIKQDTSMCKAEKEMEDRVKNEEITPEAAKGALGAKKAAIYADGPVSAGFEALGDKNPISASAKIYGYNTAPGKDCAKLLTPRSSAPAIDFFKK